MAPLGACLQSPVAHCLPAAGMHARAQSHALAGTSAAAFHGGDLGQHGMLRGAWQLRPPPQQLVRQMRQLTVGAAASGGSSTDIGSHFVGRHCLAGGVTQRAAAAQGPLHATYRGWQQSGKQRQPAAMAAVAAPAQHSEADAAMQGGDSAPEAGTAPPQRDFVVVNFYHLTDITNPQMLYRQHKAALEGLDVRGRIYISPQGINAQYSGLAADAVQYAQWVEQQPEFQGLRWTQAPVTNHMFPRLRLASRPHLVSLAGGTAHLPLTDPAARATPLAPSAWKEMLRSARRIDPAGTTAATPAAPAAAEAVSGSDEAACDNATRESKGTWRSLGGASAAAAAANGVSAATDGDAAAGGASDVVVLDVRNGYEWDAGHFQGAARPLEDQFRETPSGENGAPLPSALAGRDPDTPVMMYCTGGIRCDIYSAYLRTQGFNNLYTLEGGVHNYLAQEGGEDWNGSLFVFDNRLAVPAVRAGEEDIAAPRGGLPAAVACQLCGGPRATLPHGNCANLDCTRLFIACNACKERLRGCCCEACINAPRLLRPPMPEGGYGRVSQLFTPQQLAELRKGRGEGRMLRRRKWHARRKAEREQQKAQRAAAKEAAERGDGGFDAAAAVKAMMAQSSSAKGKAPAEAAVPGTDAADDMA